MRFKDIKGIDMDYKLPTSVDESQIEAYKNWIKIIKKNFKKKDKNNDYYIRRSLCEYLNVQSEIDIIDLEFFELGYCGRYWELSDAKEDLLKRGLLTSNL